MQLNHAFVLTLIAASLAACGGGGSSSPADVKVAVNADKPADPVAPVAPVTPVVPTATGENTGAVSARFVKGDSARFVFVSIGLQSNGKAGTLVQDASGALSDINGIVFTGNPAVTREISGDASFAQGRWFKGTFSNAFGATSLTGNNASAHYVVYNSLAALPASGTPTCDAGTFTAPAYMGGASVSPAANFGTASGTASVSFDASGAKVVLAIDASAGGSTGKVSASTHHRFGRVEQHHRRLPVERHGRAADAGRRRRWPLSADRRLQGAAGKWRQLPGRGHVPLLLIVRA